MSTSGKLLALGFAILFAGTVVLLWFANRDEATAGTSTSTSTGPAPEPAPAAPAAVARMPSPPPAAGGSKPAEAAPAPRRPEVLPAFVALAGGGAPESEEDRLEYTPEGKPIRVANLRVLRAANVPTDDDLRKCIADAGVKGLTGTAVLTYIVARKKDKAGQWIVETESSGFEDEGTTIDNAALIECMHQTAFKMKFPPNRSPMAVWVKRRIEIEAGTLKANKIFSFGGIR